MQGGIEFEDYQFQSHEITRKSRALKKKQKIQKIFNHYQDPQYKKMQRQKKKKRIKDKIAQQTKGMTQQQITQYHLHKKQQIIAMKAKLKNAKQNGLPILIDMAYQQYMNDKQRKSLAVQIQLITKAMRRLQYPCSLHLCGLGGIIQQHLQKMRYEFWPLTSHRQNYAEVGEKLNRQIIYLSPDAQQQLSEVCNDNVYVIGGLVDRTIIKNASLNRANEYNIKARRLPIDKMMINRKCLNLDHVCMIVCKYLQCKNWQMAFEYGAPKRYKKQGQQQQEQDDEQI